MEQTGVEVELVGQDGNVFTVVGRVSRALKRAGLPDVAKEYREQATACKSYDAVLRLTMSVVEVV